jgi:hypothetical protein
MNVQITDYSTNDRIDRTERYQDGTITKTGWADSNGYFNMTIVTQLHNGYRSQEQVTGYVYADGATTNVQSRMISEQLPYAPQHHRSMERSEGRLGSDLGRTFRGFTPSPDNAFDSWL